MEKGLSYFDLAENDYQFLLKDKKEGRVGNMMTVYGRAKGKRSPIFVSTDIFFCISEASMRPELLPSVRRQDLQARFR